MFLTKEVLGTQLELKLTLHNSYEMKLKFFNNIMPRFCVLHLLQTQILTFLF
jgi:hypothetical protein